MPVKSLVELATSVVLKNLKELDSVGDYLPYENIRHILLRVDTAYQLRQIELNSPHIEGDDGEIWLRLIERDFPLEFKARSYKPQNPKRWYRVWEKYKRDHDHALAESENKLRSALAGLQQTKEKNLSRVVGGSFLPSEGRKKKRRLGPRDTRTAAFDFHGGKRMKLQRGADVMRKVRREAGEIAMIHGRLSRPSGVVPKGRQLAQAPSFMVNDYRRAAQPAVRVPEERPSVVMEHEANAEFISDSENDNEDEPFSDEDETYDSVLSRPSKPARSQAPVAKAPVMVAKPSPRPAPAVEVKRKLTASSAATSLLKKRFGSKTAVVRPKPAASPTTQSQGNSNGRSDISRPTTSKSQSGISTTRSTSTTKLQTPAHPPPRPLPIDSPPNRSALPRTQTSPPLAPSAGPSSPPPSISILDASPDARPRKRKGVDIFMRPRKR